MQFRRNLVLVVLAGMAALSLSAQPITGGTADYDVTDGLVKWSITLNENASSATITTLVLGFDGPAGLPPVAWNNPATIYSSTPGVSQVDVWPGNVNGTSYLELTLASPIVFTGGSSTVSFGLLTGGILNLGNAGSVTFFADFRDGTAIMDAGLNGSSISSASLSASAANLTAIPEPSTYALLAGLMIFGVVAVRRSFCRV